MRLDKLLVEHRLVESREKAQGLIRAGEALVNSKPERKPSASVTEDAEIVLQSQPRYVGRGG